MQSHPSLIRKDCSAQEVTDLPQSSVDSVPTGATVSVLQPWRRDTPLVAVPRQITPSTGLSRLSPYCAFARAEFMEDGQGNLDPLNLEQGTWTNGIPSGDAASDADLAAMHSDRTLLQTSGECAEVLKETAALGCVLLVAL